MTNLAHLAARYAGRPLLMRPTVAQELANRLYFSAPDAFERSGRFDALLRRIGMGRPVKPAAFDDDADWSEAEAVTGPAAYSPLWMGEPDDELDWGMSLKDGIATLNLDTAISERGSYFCGEWWHGYDSLDAAFRTAFADDRVKGIFLRIDSPGGVVCGGIDVLTETIRNGRAAAGGKPVWAYADCAASAAYWIAAQCDRILAPRSGLVGSIGAVIVHMENAGMLAKHGVTVTPIQFGAQKTAGASFKALDEEAAADLQAWVDQAGRDFVAAVVEGRPLFSAEALLATEARVFAAHHADPERAGLDLGFVDELASEAAAFAALAEHVSSADPAAIPADKSAPSPAATTGAGSMAKNQKPAARRSASAKVSRLRAELAAAEEEEREALADEDGKSEEEEGTTSEGEEEEVTSEEEEETNSEGEEEEVTSEEEEDVASEDEEGKTPAARSKMRKLAIAGLPEAQKNPAYAKALADAGLSVDAAQKALRAANRSNALSARTDHGVNARSGSGNGQSNPVATLVSDYAAAFGTSRLKK